jgi:hypothetical protein
MPEAGSSAIGAKPTIANFSGRYAHYLERIVNAGLVGARWFWTGCVSVQTA